MEIVSKGILYDSTDDTIHAITSVKIDAEPILVQVLSEPYIIFASRGYQVIVPVLIKKTRAIRALYLSATSLAKQLEILRRENHGQFTGLEFWWL